MDRPILLPVAADKHTDSLIYCNIRLFINWPVIIARHVHEFDCFRRRGRGSRRFLLPKAKMFQYLFYYKIFSNKTDNLHRTFTAGAYKPVCFQLMRLLISASPILPSALSLFNTLARKISSRGPRSTLGIT